MKQGVVAAIWCLVVSFAAAEQIPIEAFAAKPTFTNLALSPDANRLAMFVNLDSESFTGTLVSIVDLRTGEKSAPLNSDNSEATLAGLLWASNDKLLVRFSYRTNFESAVGVVTRMRVVDVNSGEVRNIFADSYLRGVDHIPQFQDRVVDLLPDDPDHILMAVDAVYQNQPDLIRVDLNTGFSTIEKRGKRNLRGWVTDQQSRVRIEIFGSRGTNEAYLLDERGDRVRKLWEFVGNRNQIDILGFDGDPDFLFLAEPHEDNIAIFRIDLRDPDLTRQLVFAEPGVDLRGRLFYSRQLERVVGIATETGQRYFWEPSYQALYDQLQQALPGSHNLLYGFSEDENWYLLFSDSSAGGGTYYLGDRQSGNLRRLLEQFPALPADRMAERQIFPFDAADGSMQQAYLTLPVEPSASPLPLVVYPHGNAFIGGLFDPWTQMLASRGYAVLQVNNRRAIGVNDNNRGSALRELGATVQLDIAAATDALVASGAVDPQRICLFGMSFGGFAALKAAASDAGKYRCVATYAALTDVGDYLNNARNFTVLGQLERSIGDDRAALREQSPVSMAGRIRANTLLIHGDKDPVILPAQARDMRRALEQGGGVVELIELEDGEHALVRSDLRLQAFRAVDGFLSGQLAR